MGFFPGFVKGVALTSSFLVITSQVHLANRQHQHRLIREQIDSINTLALRSTSRDDLRSDAVVTEALARRGYTPRARPSMMELWKEKWNQDLQSFVRGVQDVEWRDVEKKVERGQNALRQLTKAE